MPVRHGTVNSNSSPEALNPMELLNYSYDHLIGFMARQYGKRAYHGDALFRHLYSRGQLDLKNDPLFDGNPELVSSLERDFPLNLPLIRTRQKEGDTLKFTLNLDPEINCETVLIPMKKYSTLCLSSQMGCRWNCQFCETGKLGLHRNLSTSEIMAQLMTARFALNADKLRNLVFMGMGEPLENLDALMESIDIMTDPRGLNLHAKHISISTAGYIPGINRLRDLCREYPHRNYQKLHLGLSLHSADPETRSSLMPINRVYPLDELKKSLLSSPYSQVKDGLYIEYIVLPGVTDKPEQIDKLLYFLEGLTAKINLIPYNPGSNPIFRKPEEEEVDRLWEILNEKGYSCRTRKSRGESVMAACGQLGRRSKPDGKSGQQLTV